MWARGPSARALGPPLLYTTTRSHTKVKPPKTALDAVHVNFVARNGTKIQVQGAVGDNLLYLAHRLHKQHPDIALEGACEASLACSTCHVILDQKSYDLLPEPSEEEDDMLDLAACLSSTSRLGCQIILKKELDGMHVTLPPYSRNYYVDGHVPEPH